MLIDPCPLQTCFLYIKTSNRTNPENCAELTCTKRCSRSGQSRCSSTVHLILGINRSRQGSTHTEERCPNETRPARTRFTDIMTVKFRIAVNCVVDLDCSQCEHCVKKEHMNQWHEVLHSQCLRQLYKVRSACPDRNDVTVITLSLT